MKTERIVISLPGDQAAVVRKDTAKWQFGSTPAMLKRAYQLLKIIKEYEGRGFEFVMRDKNKDSKEAERVIVI